MELQYTHKSQQGCIFHTPQGQGSSNKLDGQDMLSIDARYLVLAEAAETASEAEEITRRVNTKGTARPKYVYHDYSNVPDTVGYVRKKTGGVTNPFPEKLMDMLNKEEAQSSSTVSWLFHGRAFIVYDPKEFTKTIMPKYFRQTKITSFQRQLNLYGFRRITQGPDTGAYFHEMFLRGKLQLCMKMFRQKVKGVGHKQPTDVESEPNFHDMTPMPPYQEEPEIPMQMMYSPPSNSPPSPPSPAPAPPAQMIPSCSGSTDTLHSAANLLKGIANGCFSKQSFSLGPQGSSSTQSYNQHPSQETFCSIPQYHHHTPFTRTNQVVPQDANATQEHHPSLSSHNSHSHVLSNLDRPHQPGMNMYMQIQMHMPSLPSTSPFSPSSQTPFSSSHNSTVPPETSSGSTCISSTRRRNLVSRKVTMDFYSHEHPDLEDSRTPSPVPSSIM